MTEPYRFERLQLSRTATGIVEVKLNRPDKFNALDAATFDELCQVVAQLHDDKQLRAVILCGAGPSFCAGLDVSLFANPSAIADLLTRSHGDCNRYQQAAVGWRTLPVPVIAAIQGHCLGGGLQIALGADLRLVQADAKLSIMEIEWGLIPDMGLTQLAPPLVRTDQLRDLVFSGRMISGSEAVSLGLATRLAPEPIAAARAYAEQLLHKSPDALRAGKALLNQGALAAGLLAESEAMAALLRSTNHREAVAAKMAKRPPVFADPQ
ncbi:crotonase/enoyl-CoA hydratase family protein [Halioxenophilus sp. WMMB6]|uniref:crotonase/enoyl-CoA hydratase family protein n=1 Tax=Halioxenophilus sp. WMMB6 TaxID=3073815 RepID=UPI00295E3654|nr:crotonase/enoyl-CoA hydratase family protein [Halioxenophilus sp. WMMB6]